MFNLSMAMFSGKPEKPKTKEEQEKETAALEQEKQEWLTELHNIQEDLMALKSKELQGHTQFTASELSGFMSATLKDLKVNESTTFGDLMNLAQTKATKLENDLAHKHKVYLEADAA